MIKGFRGTSLVDYPGKISSVIFTYGCNFRCPYCYNLSLVLPELYEDIPDIPEDTVLEELNRRKGFIKGVVITGGEPTLWGKRLVYLIEKIKIGLNLPVKLDTNGSNPELIKKLLEMELIDYFAVDFKTSPEKYLSLGGDFSKLKLSFEYLKTVAERVEVRITCYPPLVDENDIKNMLPFLKGFKRVAIQKFVPELCPVPLKVKPYSVEVYEKFEEIIKANLPEVEVIQRYR